MDYTAEGRPFTVEELSAGLRESGIFLRDAATSPNAGSAGCNLIAIKKAIVLISTIAFFMDLVRNPRDELLLGVQVMP